MKYSHQVQVQEVQGFQEFLVFQVTQEIRHLLVGQVIQEPQGHPKTNTVVTLQIDLAFFVHSCGQYVQNTALSHQPYFTLLALPSKEQHKPNSSFHTCGYTQQVPALTQLPHFTLLATPNK